jgi:hypothetical protein
MERNRIYIVLCGIICCYAISCTKPYAPKAISSPNNYLVVEGEINTGNDSTIIKLSRTVALNATVTQNPELGATVVIQDDQNQSYNLTSVGNGFYTSPVLNLSSTRKYRLSISTADGKSYLSDFVTAVPSPPIDSIGFTIVSNKQMGAGMQIYVNTHDPNNNTHYYRWDYTETWQFHAKYQSNFITNGVDDLVPRTPAQQIYQCYGNDISTDIVLGSSAKLTQDVIYQAPITFIASTSEKIETRYTILINQYALTSDGYNYFTQLKKNTEELGSIFDAQPSQLTGNVHCTTDATLPVIGYITAGSIQQKRVFIDNRALPPSWVETYPYDCDQDTAFYNNPKTHVNQVLQFLVPGYELATSGLYSGPGKPYAYQYSGAACADCTIRGTLTKPSFWQDYHQ